jgi:hypothetical protein
MDEPIHANENRFWDQVADWLLGLNTLDVQATQTIAVPPEQGPGTQPPQSAAD